MNPVEQPPPEEKEFQKELRDAFDAAQRERETEASEREEVSDIMRMQEKAMMLGRLEKKAKQKLHALSLKVAKRRKKSKQSRKSRKNNRRG